MNRLTANVSILLLAILCVSCSQGEKKITLRYKFVPGQKLVYEQVSKRDVKVLEADSVIDRKTTTLEATIIQEVAEVLGEDSALIYETDIWHYERPAKDDSTTMETVEETRETTLKVLANGKLLDIEFHGEESKSKVAYIRNFFEQGLPVFPGGEVSPGYNWTQTTKVMLPEGVMEASSNYIVRSLARESGYDCAVIECDGNLIIPIEPDPTDTAQRRGVDHIETTGKLYFAYKNGFVVLQRERWLINGDRTEIKAGEPRQYKIAVTIDVDFALKEHTVEL